MTFTQIVDSVKDRLNLTSTTSDTRIGKEVNQVYREVTTSIGLGITRQVKRSTTATPASSLITFTSLEKIDRVWTDNGDGPIILQQVTLDELRNENTPTNDRPYRYAEFSVTSTSITIQMDIKASTGFTIYADGLAEVADLTGSDEPAFSESFHDVLVEGALIKEYRKIEKQALARDSELTFQRRLSDLKMFVAKSRYLTIRQGDTLSTRGRMRLESVFGRNTNN